MPKGNKCFLVECVRKNPALSSTKLFCCISTYPNVSVPLTLTRTGSILSSSGTEYKLLGDWVEHEFVPQCPSHADKSVIIKRINSKRDFFTEPCRRGKTFVQLVDEVTSTSTFCPPECGEQFFSKVTETSHLFVSELILFVLMKVTCFKISNFNETLINEYAKVLNTFSDMHIKVDDINNYLTNYRIFTSRSEIFQQITASFCHYNANELIKYMLNHGDYNKSILAEAHGICNNLTENSRLSTLMICGANAMISLKYILHSLDKQFQHWQFMIGSDDNAFIWNSDNVIDKQIIIQQDFSWKAVVNRKYIDLEGTDLSDKIKDISDVTSIIKAVDNLKLCKGLCLDQFSNCLQDDLINDYFVQDEQVLGLFIITFFPVPHVSQQFQHLPVTYVSIVLS